MSKENADDKCEQKKNDIRGEILLTAFIKKILLAKSEVLCFVLFVYFGMNYSSAAYY